MRSCSSDDGSDVVLGLVLGLQGELGEDLVADVQEVGARAVAPAVEVDVDDALDMAGVRCHDDDAVRQDDGFVDVVRDEYDGLVLLAADGGYLILELHAGQGVEGGEWLVHEQDLGVDRESAGDGDTLLHAAGQLGRMPVSEIAESDEFEVFLRDGSALGRRTAEALEAQLDIVLDGAPGQQAVVLEYGHVFDRGGCDRLAVDGEAAGRGTVEPRQHVQQG